MLSECAEPHESHQTTPVPKEIQVECVNLSIKVLILILYAKFVYQVVDKCNDTS